MKVELVGGSWDAVDPLLPLGDPACSQWLSLHEGTSSPRSLLTEAIVKAWPEPAGAIHRLSSDGKELRLSPPLWSCVQPLRVFLLFLPGECTGGLSLHSHKMDIALVSNNLLEQPLPSLHPIHPQHTHTVCCRIAFLEYPLVTDTNGSHEWSSYVLRLWSGDTWLPMISTLRCSEIRNCFPSYIPSFVFCLSRITSSSAWCPVSWKLLF